MKQILFLLFSALISLSCSNSINSVQNTFGNSSQSSSSKFETVTVNFPEWDLQSFKLDEWIIEIQSESYCDKYFVPGDTNTIRVSIIKNKPLSITATPLTKQNDSRSTAIFFKPAGTIYPYDFINNELDLSWETGFSAYLMQQLFKSNDSKSKTSKTIQTFNWKKFNNLIKTKILESEDALRFSQDDTIAFQSQTSNNNYFNPWLCDLEKIMNNLCYSRFSTTNLNNKNCNSINISQIHAEFSKTYPESPFSIIYSSFVPENSIIQNLNLISIKTDTPNYFALKNQNLCILVNSDKTKKVSIQVINMPIFIDKL